MSINNLGGIPFLQNYDPDIPLEQQLYEWQQKFGSSQQAISHFPVKPNNSDDFKAASRAVWKSMRQGTPYEQPEPDTGPYTANFYGLEKEEGVDLPSLIDFIFNATVDHTLVF